MMENHKDSKAMSLFEEFCDVDTLQNRQDAHRLDDQPVGHEGRLKEA